MTRDCIYVMCASFFSIVPQPDLPAIRIIFLVEEPRPTAGPLPYINEGRP
jgi:hypothetical protein